MLTHDSNCTRFEQYHLLCYLKQPKKCAQRVVIIAIIMCVVAERMGLTSNLLYKISY